MVSMKDIAAACHVSVATVSKALNGHRDISEETKLHIKKVAKDMGYFPNSVARALKTNKTFEFLKEKTQVNFVSTIDGDSPSCRPFKDPMLFDNKINCAIIARSEAKKYDK